MFIQELDEEGKQSADGGHSHQGVSSNRNSYNPKINVDNLEPASRTRSGPVPMPDSSFGVVSAKRYEHQKQLQNSNIWMNSALEQQIKQLSTNWDKPEV